MGMRGERSIIMKRILKFESLDERELDIAEAAFTLALIQTAGIQPGSGFTLKQHVELVLNGEEFLPEFSVRTQLNKTLTDQTLLDRQKERYEAA
jgi:hypothetical protein